MKFKKFAHHRGIQTKIFKKILLMSFSDFQGRFRAVCTLTRSDLLGCFS